MHFTKPIAFVALAALPLALCLPACSVDAGDSGEREVVAQAAQASTTCSAATTCCIGQILPFDMTDPFQAQLSAWGCLPPRVFAPNKSTNAWWFWSGCLDPGKRVETFLNGHPALLKPPYSVITAANLSALNLPIAEQACTPQAPANGVEILWDPTCATCKPQ